MSALNGVVQPKRVFDSFPNYCCQETWFGLNRISHPDWGKLCIELNYAPNKNTKIPSATPSTTVDQLTIYIVYIYIYTCTYI